MDSQTRVSVVYADDDAQYRTRMLHALLAEEQGLDVVAVAVDGDAALQAIRTHDPDVALLDADTAGLSGLDIAEAVAASRPRPHTRVLLLATMPLSSTSRALDAVGLDGIIDRGRPREEVVAAVRSAAGQPAAGPA